MASDSILFKQASYKDRRMLKIKIFKEIKKLKLKKHKIKIGLLLKFNVRKLKF